MYNSYFFHCNLGVVSFCTTKKRQLNHQLCDNWQMFVFLREVEHRIGNGLGQYGPYVFSVRPNIYLQSIFDQRTPGYEYFQLSKTSLYAYFLFYISHFQSLTDQSTPGYEYIQPLSCDLSNIICYADPTLSWSPAMIILPTNACLVGAKPLS